MIDTYGIPVGQLRRFRVKGQVFLSWYCDCPDCTASHGKMFRLDEVLLDNDPEHVVTRILNGTGYEFEDVEWYDGPEIEELPIGEDERMKMLGAPMLLGELS